MSNTSQSNDDMRLSHEMAAKIRKAFSNCSSIDTRVFAMRLLADLIDNYASGNMSAQEAARLRGISLQMDCGLYVGDLYNQLRALRAEIVRRVSHELDNVIVKPIHQPPHSWRARGRA